MTVDDPFQAQPFGHLHEHRPVIDIDNFFSGYLGYVQSDLPDISIRLAEMDEAGRDKKSPQIRIPIRRLAI